MKTIFLAIIFLMFPVLLMASDNVYDTTALTNGVVIQDTNYPLNLSSGRVIDYLSFQAVYSTITYTSVTFIDGVQSTGTITVSATTGQIGSTITIAGVNLVEGIAWTHQTVSSNTAKSLYAGCTTYVSNVIFNLPNSSAVIYTTASVVGVNYTMSSTAAGIVVTNMTGGVATDIDYVHNLINKSNSYAAGIALLLTANAGTLPNNLSAGTTYFAIPSATAIGLASTKANAIAGTSIVLSSQTYPGSGSFTLTPAVTQTASPFTIQWQYSNDNQNWYNSSLSSTSITGATATSNYLWDFGFTTYKYIRAAVTAGSFGAINLKLQGYGKREQ